jgi:hypothetical protein
MSLRIDRDRIKRQFNPLVRVRSAVRRNPLPVFATTAAAALLLTLLLRRRNRDDRPFRARRMLFGWFLALAKPAARLWIANWAKDRFLPLPPPFQATDRANTP